MANVALKVKRVKKVTPAPKDQKVTRETQVKTVERHG